MQSEHTAVIAEEGNTARDPLAINWSFFFSLYFLLQLFGHVSASEGWIKESKYLPFKRHFKAMQRPWCWYLWIIFLTVPEFGWVFYFPCPLRLLLDKPTEYCIEKMFYTMPGGSVNRDDTSQWLMCLHCERLRLEKYMSEEEGWVGNGWILPAVLTSLFQFVEAKVEQWQKVHYLKHITL